MILQTFKDYSIINYLNYLNYLSCHPFLLTLFWFAYANPKVYQYLQIVNIL